jgi:hypothetical protein
MWDDGGRLRVVTAGDIGSIERYLGDVGFDVVTVDDQPALLNELKQCPDVDAVVIDANFCTSLEPVAKLVPAAIIIVVGDHTPEGALGRIEAGVTGTTMAGLLHALVSGGIAAATVIPGFVPAEPKPPAPTIAGGRKGRVFASGAAGTLLVSAVAVAMLSGGGYRAATPLALAPTVSPASSRSAITINRRPPHAIPSPAQIKGQVPAERGPKVSNPATTSEVPASSSVAAAAPPNTAPQPAPSDSSSAGPSPSPTTSPEPTGNSGWTNVTEHEDNGKHLGWDKRSDNAPNLPIPRN